MQVDEEYKINFHIPPYGSFRLGGLKDTIALRTWISFPAKTLQRICPFLLLVFFPFVQELICQVLYRQDMKHSIIIYLTNIYY